jgi:hypothetical protein
MSVASFFFLPSPLLSSSYPPIQMPPKKRKEKAVYLPDGSLQTTFQIESEYYFMIFYPLNLNFCPSDLL